LPDAKNNVKTTLKKMRPKVCCSGWIYFDIRILWKRWIVVLHLSPTLSFQLKINLPWTPNLLPQLGARRDYPPLSVWRSVLSSWLQHTHSAMDINCVL